MHHRLNAPQRLMLQWKEFCVYNACHAIQLSTQLDAERLQKILLQQLQQLGIGSPEFSKDFATVSYSQLNRLDISVTDRPLDSVIQQQMNLPFAMDAVPLRCFIVNGEPNSCYLLICYDHWLADGYSIRQLLLRLVMAYYKQSAKLVLKPLQVTIKPSATALFNTTKQARQFSRVARTPLQDHTNFTTGTLSKTLPRGLLTSLKIFSKQHNMTLNDVFVAALAHVMAESSSTQRQQAKAKLLKGLRNQVAIGNIVDLRPWLNADYSNSFGQLLSNFSIYFSDKILKTEECLLSHTATATQRIKAKRIPIKNFFSWKVMLWLLQRQRTLDSKAKFHHKTSCLNASISNFNLNREPLFSALEESKLALSPYIRVVPTGPLCPLVFAINGFQNDLNVAISFRETAFQRTAVEKIYLQWQQQLQKWADYSA